MGDLGGGCGRHRHLRTRQWRRISRQSIASKSPWVPRVSVWLRRDLTLSGRDCALLWLRAIEFERLLGRFDAAKTLFYRAMGHIGSCKGENLHAS